MSQNPPVYDENEPPYVYLKKLNEYVASLDRERYKEILCFLNKLTEGYGKKYKSLCDFKNIPSTLLTNMAYNKKIISTHGEETAKKLKIKFNFDDIDNLCIYDFISALLKPINYSLVKKTFNDKTYYSIDNAPKKYSSSSKNYV